MRFLDLLILSVTAAADRLAPDRDLRRTGGKDRLVRFERDA
jgi:hypothetical protein